MSAFVQQVSNATIKRTITLKVLNLFHQRKKEEFGILHAPLHPAEKFKKLRQTQRKYDTRYEKIVGR